MASDKYTRWQGYAIAQPTFALNLFLGLSIGALAFGISLIRDDAFVLSGCSKIVFGLGLVALALSVVGGCSAVVSRLFDFRYTARKVRADDQLDPEDDAGVYKYRSRVLGQVTWWLFGFELLSFLFGLVGLFVGLYSKYKARLW